MPTIIITIRRFNALEGIGSVLYGDTYVFPVVKPPCMRFVSRARRFPISLLETTRAAAASNILYHKGNGCACITLPSKYACKTLEHVRKYTFERALGKCIIIKTFFYLVLLLKTNKSNIMYIHIEYLCLCVCVFL